MSEKLDHIQHMQQQIVHVQSVQGRQIDDLQRVMIAKHAETSKQNAMLFDMMQTLLKSVTKLANGNIAFDPKVQLPSLPLRHVADVEQINTSLLLPAFLDQMVYFYYYKFNTCNINRT